MSEFVGSVKEFERMGVPKTCIVGFYDPVSQEEFMVRNQEKIDFWISDLN